MLHKYTKCEGLQGLKDLYTLLVWFSDSYTDQKVSLKKSLEGLDTETASIKIVFRAEKHDALKKWKGI